MHFSKHSALAALAATITTTVAAPLTINNQNFDAARSIESALDSTVTTAIEVASSIGGAFRLMVAGCGGDDCAERNDGLYIKHVGGSLHPADGSGTSFLLDTESERLTDSSGQFVAAVNGIGSGSQLFMADQQTLADNGFVPLRCFVNGGDRLQCAGPNLAEIALCNVETTARTSETKVSLLSRNDDNHNCPLAVLYVEPE